MVFKRRQWKLSYQNDAPRKSFATFLLKFFNTFTMFNLYQNINKKEDQEKEPDVIGHERFYQARSRSTKKKKRVTRRTHSAAEFSPTTLSAANKRAAFRARSQSSETKSDDGRATPQRADSLAKMFFGKRQQGSVQKHEYSALKTDGGNEKFRGERQIRNGAFITCRNNLENNERYELKTQLDDIGSRADKHWFIVQDNILGAERLLALLPLPSTCPISPSQVTRDTLLSLFRGLQHPYIHPVLDIEFWDAGAAVVSPLNPTGSLKDLIYGSVWHEDYEKKYTSRGEGLSLRTVQCLGRQILEGLLFLRNRYFPPIYHLHSGNVIIQNGVARLAGLENPLLGLLPKAPSAPETLSFGYLLFEMTAGYELPGPPSPAHLQLELERAPKVAEALEYIFQTSRTPSLDELVRCDLFRGVELRELRGASIIQSVSPPDVLDLLEMVKNPVPPSPLRRPSSASKTWIKVIKTRKKSKYVFINPQSKSMSFTK
ncbi:slowpoke-binding protein isoform X2 [Diabrotica undecimpunctata]|uniref:slowpoke-binding protein isoform X2 n=1 Tax=Diabrotica undecimpunctata TaxID=50387 RepID=UPI003B634304